MKNQLIVQPTKILIDKTVESLLKYQGVEATVIYGEYVAIKQTINFLENCNEVNEVLMITWSCYSKLPLYYIEKIQKNFEVYVDEIPTVDKFYQFNLFDNKNLFNRYLTVINVDDSLGIVNPINLSEIQDFIKNEDTVYSKELDELFQNIASPYYDVFVHHSDLEKNDEKSRIYFISMLNPKLFQGATLLGANLERSMLYHWFTGFHKVKFKDHKKIISKLDAPFDLSNKIEINFLTDKSNTKGFKNKKDDNGVFNHQLIHKLVKQHFKGDKFLFSENKKIDTTLLDDIENSKKLPVVANGLNEYQDYKNIAFLPALNRSPQHFGMLDQLGVSSDTVKESSNFETMYQAIMRMCLRDKDSTEIVNVFVISEEEARFLVKVTGDQKIKKVFESEYIQYQRVEPKSQADRTQKYKINKALIEGSRDPFEYKVLKKQYNHIDSGVYFTWHEGLKTESDLKQFSLLKFKRLLKSVSKQVVQSKDESYLINASIFASQKHWERSNNNYVSSSMLILDYDGGDLSIQDFERIFWKGEKTSFIICNSFSRDYQNPNKFRVFIPFNKPVYSLEHHFACFDAVLKILERSGYTQESMKLDSQSRSAVASYFLPCINESAQDWAYFKSYGWSRTSELKRCLFDVSICKPIEQNKKCKVVAIDRKVKNIDTKIDEVKQTYLSIPVGRKLRNNGLFTAGVTLLNYLDFDEIEGVINELAGSDRKMKSRVKDVMSSLKNYKDVA